MEEINISPSDEIRVSVTGLFMTNESTAGLAIDLLALVLNETARDLR